MSEKTRERERERERERAYLEEAHRELVQGLV